jgi:TPR repeat protein
MWLVSSKNLEDNQLVARIWNDRLVEVWADPAKAGAGVAIADAGVLTARHVVAGADGGGRVLARVIRRGEPAEWVPMVVLAADADWDLALLGLDPAAGPAGWRVPSSPAPVIVRLGAAAEARCEAVGFPQAEVVPAADLRQTEQVTGTLLPAGQSRSPVSPDRTLPVEWMPFDVTGATPANHAGWAGMSGAGVTLPDGRLAGLVTCSEAGHQQRRLYVVPLAEALERSAAVSGQLSAMPGGPLSAEVRDAPVYRDILQAGCLGSDGAPVLVGEAGLGGFGVKPAGVPGESAFLDYVPRDGDQQLDTALQMAGQGRRMLLLAGGSASGKSRSAAEGTRRLFGGRQLLCPRSSALARLREAVAEPEASVVWLDDVERFQSSAFRDILEWLLNSGTVVVATIRRSELEAILPHDDLRHPLGDVLTDKTVVQTIDWPVMWTDSERARVSHHIANPALLDWVSAGKPPTTWIVAGPALEDKLRLAEHDDERPVRYALVRTVLDWYRAGAIEPVPAAVAAGLLSAAPAEVHDALEWACAPVLGVGRGAQSLLTRTASAEGLLVHDYIRDADARTGTRPVPDTIWSAALEHVSTPDGRFWVGYAASGQAPPEVAIKAFLPLANSGNPYAMHNLANILEKDQREQARRWFTMAARLGLPPSMVRLARLIEKANPGQARRWLEKAAATGDTAGMMALGVFLVDRNPGQARLWFERAAAAGETNAMFNLARLAENINDRGEALRWYTQAADAGHTKAMNNLGAHLSQSDPAQAREWFQKAADAGDATGWFNLGYLISATDQEAARQSYEKAAQAGNTPAMNNLGVLVKEDDPEQARRWWQQAAEAGNPAAMANLSVLIEDSDPEQSDRLIARVAEWLSDRNLSLSILTDPAALAAAYHREDSDFRRHSESGR